MPAGAEVRSRRELESLRSSEVRDLFQGTLGEPLRRDLWKFRSALAAVCFCSGQVGNERRH